MRWPARWRRCRYCRGGGTLRCYLCDGTGRDCLLCVAGRACCPCPAGNPYEAVMLTAADGTRIRVTRKTVARR